MTTSYLIIVLLLLILTGYVARKLKIVDEGFAKNLSSFLFNIAYPAMIIDSMQFSFTKENFIQSSRLIVLSVFVLFISWLVAIFANKLMKSDDETKGVVIFAIMYSNFTFMAIPIIEELYGKELLFYLAMFTAIMRISYNTLGVNSIARSMNKKTGFQKGSIINPPLVAIVIGLILYLFSIRLPYPLEKAMAMLSKTVSPFGMIVTGLIIAEYSIKDIFKDYRVYIISLFRLIVIPLIVIIVANIFDFTDIERQISVIVSAMPVATTCVMIATKYEANSKLAAEAAFVSTILSTITIPIIVMLV